MEKFVSSLKNFILDILFPRFCLNCSKEGNYLCPDCASLISISDRQYCPFCSEPKIVFGGRTCPRCRRTKKLSGLYYATSYADFLPRKIIKKFKYEPFAKELAEPLSSLIISYLINLNKLADFADFFTIPIPSHRKKLKQRGFNPAEEIGKKITKVLKIPLLNEVLVKTKPTAAQADLQREERLENIKGVFHCQRPELIAGKKILLIDDVFTTGATMEECATELKKAGAKEVWGMAVARG